MVGDATLEHLDRGTEARHLDHLLDLLESLAGEAVLDLGLLLVLLATSVFTGG